MSNQIKQLGTKKVGLDKTDLIPIQEAGDTTRHAEVQELMKSNIFFGALQYSDLATQTTPISVTGGGGFVDITNDGLAAFSSTLYAPVGVTDTWNTSTNRLDFTELPLGSKFSYHVDLEITTNSANQEVIIEVEIGLGGVPLSLGVIQKQFKNVGTHKTNIHNFLVMLDLNTRDNPAKLKIKSDGNLDVKVNGFTHYTFLYI